MGSFPEHRLRRLRRNEATRAMFTETRLHASQLVWPVFVADGLSEPQAINSLPGQSVHTIESLLAAADSAMQTGVRSLILFGKPHAKDEEGSEADNEHGIVQESIRALKKRFGDDLVVMADVCLCQYTSHGHCGILHGQEVDNDETLGRLASVALSYAEAGVDWVAPSDMMDGRVGMIRNTLDEEDFSQVAIMSYAVKYASAFYGPFRDAVDSTPSFGDRRSYQMDPANQREALLEAMQDEEEGADALMVKPAGPFLDILHLISSETDLPLAAYQVSGEYAMLHAAAEKNWLDYDRALMESVTGIVRAGADLVLTYAAPEIAGKL